MDRKLRLARQLLKVNKARSEDTQEPFLSKAKAQSRMVTRRRVMKELKSMLGEEFIDTFVEAIKA